MLVGYALHNARFGLDVERTAATYRNPPHIHTLFLARWHYCRHHVAGFETVNDRGCFGAGAREAVLIHPTHLARTMAFGIGHKHSIA